MKFAATTSFVVSLGLCLVLGPTILAEQRQDRPTRAPKSRTFRLDYGARLHGLPPQSRVRVWLPAPQSSDHQKITRLETVLPVAGQTAIDPTYGNKILYFETTGPPFGRNACSLRHPTPPFFTSPE